MTDAEHEWLLAIINEFSHAETREESEHAFDGLLQLAEASNRAYAMRQVETLRQYSPLEIH